MNTSGSGAPRLVRHRAAARAILAMLFGPAERRAFAVRYWDGSGEAPAGPAAFTLHLGRPGALRRMLLPATELSLGEAFVRGDFDVDGDLTAAASLGGAVQGRARSLAGLARLLPLLLSLPADDLPAELLDARPRPRLGGRLHERATDAANVRAHYDLGNDFYALWLDARMVYSCAYFRTGGETLDDAQEAKLELICRKLRLEPGERLLDVGCGWGALAVHAALHHGARVTGITLSEPQALDARARATAAGVADRVQIEVRDYRDLPASATFEKIASVGMVEHVGRENVGRYFAQAARLLRPGGAFLCHGIVELRPPPRGPGALVEGLAWRRASFLQRYIFPGGEVLRASVLLAAAEAAGLEARDLESLREHYALTARCWSRRLEERRDEAVGLVGERTVRAYRLYLAAVVHTFEAGVNGLNQILLVRPHEGGASRLPLTREDLYQPRPIAG